MWKVKIGISASGKTCGKTQSDAMMREMSEDAMDLVVLEMSKQRSCRLPQWQYLITQSFTYSTEIERPKVENLMDTPSSSDTVPSD